MDTTSTGASTVEDNDSGGLHTTKSAASGDDTPQAYMRFQKVSKELYDAMASRLPPDTGAKRTRTLLHRLVPHRAKHDSSNTEVHVV